METASLDKFGQTTARTIFMNPPFGAVATLLSPSNWVRVKLRLETAGPVAVGTNNKSIIPVLAGGGALLGTDELEFILKKGDYLYAAANATNRVRMITEPIPWQEQILLRLGDVVGSILGLKPTAAPTPPKKGPMFGNIGGKKW